MRFVFHSFSSAFMLLPAMPSRRASCAAISAGSFGVHFSRNLSDRSSQPDLSAFEQSDTPPASSMYPCMYLSLPSSVHMASEVFFTYAAPATPVALLKYRMVGQPPAPGLCSPRICSSDRLTSPKETPGCLAYSDTALSQAGACLRHQPQPADAIQRT